MKTSAPAIASLNEPVRFSLLVCAASQRRSLSSRSSLSEMMPLAIHPDDVADAFASRATLQRSRRRPRRTQYDDSDVLHVLADHAKGVEQCREHDRWPFRAGRRGKTGMSSRSRRRRSISKQRGAEMSSRLMPPVDRRDALDDPSRSRRRLGRETDRPRVNTGEALEQECLALPSPATPLPVPMLPSRARRSVGHDGDGIALDRQLRGAARRSLAIAIDMRATPGCRPSRGRLGS